MKKENKKSSKEQQKNTSTDLSPEEEEKFLITEGARQDLLSFVMMMKDDYVVNWHHDIIAEKLEETLRAVQNKKKKRIILCMPPRHGKSELATISFPAWALGNNPKLHIMCASYTANLAEKFGLRTKDIIKDNSFKDIFPNTKIRKDVRAKANWMTTEGGHYIGAGVGGPITGSGANIAIIDDPLKNREEAESQTYRDKVWDWYTSTLYTRMEGYGAIIVIACMTGDTKVLMGDYSEKELKDIRVGDEVATYKEGKLCKSKVKNWCSNGRDSVFTITMSSGKVVRANARHPFLVHQDNKLVWKRVKNLSTAHKIVTLKGTSDFTLDEIVSIEESGVEEVFDLQVEETENFIANGLVSHNTRWHNDDLIGRLLEKQEADRLAGEKYYDEWELIDFKAIAEDDEPPYRKAGEPLWPEKFSLDNLKTIKNISIYDWAALYQQTPIIAETQEFRSDWFKTYEPEDEDFTKLYCNYYTLVDPSVSQKKTADNTVVLTIAKEVGGPRIFRVKEDAGRMKPNEMIDVIFKHRNEYKSQVYVETTAYQESLKYWIQEEQIKREDHWVVNEIRPRAAKQTRIRGLIGPYANGVIHHLYTDKEYERELLEFPFGKRDDRIDTMAMALQVMDNTQTADTGFRQFKKKFIGYFEDQQV